MVNRVSSHGRGLTAERIVDAAARVYDRGGDDFSLRELGAELGVHPTAMYRHFRDKQEILLAVADRALEGVAAAADQSTDPFEAAGLITRSLRKALLTRPSAARVLSSGPARQPNELELSDRLLGCLRAGGLGDLDAVDAYHTLIEYAVGSAVIDHPLWSLENDDRQATYRRWRADYLGLDASQYPNLVELAPRMYHDASDQFSYGLALILDSLQAKAQTTS